jgi:hypothetical protein
LPTPLISNILCTHTLASGGLDTWSFSARSEVAKQIGRPAGRTPGRQAIGVGPNDDRRREEHVEVEVAAIKMFPPNKDKLQGC